MSAERRIRDLVRDLRPVRPIPRLGLALAALFTAWALVVVLHWLLGAPPLLLGGRFWSDPAFVAVASGLALAAAGGLLASLAGAVPGRGRPARVGLQTALAGAALVLGGSLWQLAMGLPAEAPLPFSVHVACALRSGGLGIAPALLAGLFLAAAAPGAGSGAAALAGVGAASLGAAAVHASCSASDAVHWMLGHGLGPLAAAALLALPLALWVSRSGRG